MKRKPKLMPQEEPRHVAAYIRVSSQRQANEGDSLASQQSEIDQEIEQRKRRYGMNVQVVERYIDAGKSAKNQNRPQLQRLKEDIRAGKINVVICFKLDRITRSLKDFVELWSLFEEYGVDVISIREQFDSSTPTGRAMLRLIMVFAELEREMTAERTISTMLNRAERGLWNGGHVLGYISDPQERGKLIIDQAGAEIVRKIFDLLEQLGSGGAVTKKLNELGIKYPAFQTRSGQVRGGKPFVKQKVLGILRNDLYLGRVKWGQSVTDNCHEAIISSQQFERVQNLLRQTTQRRHNPKQTHHRRYLLSGMLRCQCGASMVGMNAHGRDNTYYYYGCSQQSHAASKNSCTACRIPAEALEVGVLNRLRQLAILPESREAIVKQAIIKFGGLEAQLQEEEATIRRQTSQLSAEKGRLLEVLKAQGAKGLASVQGELERIESQEKVLKTELKKIATRQQPLQGVAQQAAEFMQNWAGIDQLFAEANPDELHAILQHFVDVLEIHSSDSKSKSGQYTLQLFPGVKLGQEYKATEAGGLKKNAPEMTNGTVADAGNDPEVLTEYGLVRTTDQKAPRVGLEPTT
ncbi:MAG: recombinase family protein [Pirellulales bacterium]